MQAIMPIRLILLDFSPFTSLGAAIVVSSKPIHVAQVSDLQELVTKSEVSSYIYDIDKC
jgi:hypothetical protein